MNEFQFRRAVREGVPLLIGLAGGTGSGKTYSAMLLARGLSGDKPFAVIDTEAGRAKHYADQFSFDHGDLGPPFRPAHYMDAIAAADKAGYPVIVVDSMSHEYNGDGGILDWHEEELTRMAPGEDWKRREAMTFAAWVKPKAEHKRLVSKLLQIRAHLILCFRAEEKIEIVKRDGKTEVIPKTHGAGFKGWIPVTEKNLPYELTTSLLLTADAPGIPKPIKLQEQHRAFFPLDKPISEQAGKSLAEWSRGGTAPEPRQRAEKPENRPGPNVDTDTGEMPRGEIVRPLWTHDELKQALTDSALTIKDLSPILGSEAARENYAELIDTWMFHNPGKRIADLIAAAVAHHTSPPAEPQPALLGAE